MLALPWYGYACITIISATGIHFFSKLAKGMIDPLIAVIYTMAAGLIVAFAFYPFARETFDKSITNYKALALYALIGFCITVAHIGIYFMFKSGAPMSMATPLVRFAPAVFALFLGLFIFHETIKLHQWLGILLAFGGFYLMTKS